MHPTVSKKKPVKTALRRRSRAERSVPRDRHRNEILDALNSAGAPLTAQELAARLDVKGGERRALDAALAALERSEERRVGKECRSRWWRYSQNKNKEKR